MRPTSLLLAVVASATSLHAQAAVWVDAGASRTRLADQVDGTALSISPAIQLVGARSRLDASGTLSSFAGATSTSGWMEASLSSANLGLISLDLDGRAGGSSHSDATRTGEVLALGRVRLDGTRAGAWAGAGLGRAWDGGGRAVRQADAGVWMAGTSAALSLGITPTVVDDTIRYSDASLGVRRVVGDWEWNASFGARFGDQMPALPANSRTWGSVGVVKWVSPRMGVVAGAGTYPVDFTQGFPGGRYLTLSLRMLAARTARAGALEAEGAAVAAGIDRFAVTTVSGGERVIRVVVRDAQSVEVTGDFTSWAPVPLVSSARNEWTVRMPIAAGTHEVNVRVNGGAWLVPPGLTPLKDEFGSMSGILVIP